MLSNRLSLIVSTPTAFDTFASAYPTDVYGIKAALEIETGRNWLLTPVKNSYIRYPDLSQSPPWYFREVWASHYLDLRVVAIDLTVLLVLLVVVPIIASVYSSRRAWLLICASLSVGVLFGVTLTLYPVCTGYAEGWPVLAATPLTTITLAAFGWRHGSAEHRGHRCLNAKREI